jgi:catechol 2,3-dioxygenase-like lactoylglutathione lyase family enzyme
MRRRRSSLLVLIAQLLAVYGAWSQPAPKASENAPPPGHSANAVLINTCLITSDVRKLAAFYARVLQIEPRWDGDSYVEFRTGAGILALFADDAQEKYIPGSATPGRNRSAILEFKVSDVDREYTRLRDLVEWVKGPTTQPWGTRSIYFRDPDGNLIDFFVPSQNR